MSEPQKPQKVEVINAPSFRPRTVQFGCLSPIVSLMALYALVCGLPTPWGVLCFDLFFPAIRLEAPAPESGK